MPLCPDCGGVMISGEPIKVRGKWQVPLDCIECGSGVYTPYTGTCDSLRRTKMEAQK